MAGLCAVLNLTAGQKEGPANLAVNVIMFLIIGVILISCERNAFFPMNRIIGDLTHATEKIRNDAMNSRQFLWEPYNSGNVELFQEPELKQRFRDYVFELNRIENTEKAYYKCDIEDYLNEGLVDTVMHRNILNQVAGVMTGLGILGTFIGLSLGLQHFSTGTTAEVTNSIAPLMDGIKVAFHTSIYGMVFSLVFNFVYKCKLEEGENAVRDFLADSGMSAEQIERVSYLVGHHHTLNAIDGLDYQILIEADLIVNACEKGWNGEKMKHLRDTVMKTAAGKRIVGAVFGV